MTDAEVEAELARSARPAVGPQFPDKRELLERAAKDTNWHPSILAENLGDVGWTVERLRTELETPGWFDRLRAELRNRAIKEAIESQVWTALKNGPVAMARVSEEELVSTLPPKLASIATTWTPVDGGLLLIGPTEAGKTRAAVAVVKRIIRIEETEVRSRPRLSGGRSYPRTDITWARASDLALARHGHPLGKGEPEALEKARSAGLLVVDDLGWERQFDAVADVLASRYDAGKITIATSGQPVAALSEKYGDAVVRRIVQSRGIKGQIVSLFASSKPVAVGGRK